jgi:hypothetical protein
VVEISPEHKIGFDSKKYLASNHRVNNLSGQNREQGTIFSPQLLKIRMEHLNGGQRAKETYWACKSLIWILTLTKYLCSQQIHKERKLAQPYIVLQ